MHIGGQRAAEVLDRGWAQSRFKAAPQNMDSCTKGAVGDGPALTRQLGDRFLNAWNNAAAAPGDTGDAGLFGEQVQIFCPDGCSLWLPGVDPAAIIGKVVEKVGHVIAVQDMRAAYAWVWIRGAGLHRLRRTWLLLLGTTRSHVLTRCWLAW
jgi:hypothetical protein|eukprot:COSAG01_NODE_1306_length_10805_cov_29.835700_17_plen_152_part_00